MTEHAEPGWDTRADWQIEQQRMVEVERDRYKSLLREWMEAEDAVDAMPDGLSDPGTVEHLIWVRNNVREALDMPIQKYR